MRVEKRVKAKRTEMSGDVTDNLGLWLSLGVSLSSIIWIIANYKALKKSKD